MRSLSSWMSSLIPLFASIRRPIVHFVKMSFAKSLPNKCEIFLGNVFRNQCAKSKEWNKCRTFPWAIFRIFFCNAYGFRMKAISVFIEMFHTIACALCNRKASALCCFGKCVWFLQKNKIWISHFEWPKSQKSIHQIIKWLFGYCRYMENVYANTFASNNAKILCKTRSLRLRDIWELQNSGFGTDISWYCWWHSLIMKVSRFAPFQSKPSHIHKNQIISSVKELYIDS